MISRTMSHACAFVAIVSVGSTYSANGVIEQINANKYTLGAIAFGTALPKDADAARAAAETIGMVVDNGNKMHSLAVPVNFGVNWVTRKAMRGMGANKIKLSSFGSTGNDVGEIAAEAISVAAPQLVAALAIMALNGSVGSNK